DGGGGQCGAGQVLGQFAAAQHGAAADQDVLDTGGQAPGLLVGGVVLDGLGIDQCNIGGHTGSEPSAVTEAEALGGAAGQVPGGLRPGPVVAVAHAFGQKPGEGAPAARMRPAAEVDRIRGGDVPLLPQQGAYGFGGVGGRLGEDASGPQARGHQQLQHGFFG